MDFFLQGPPCQRHFIGQRAGSEEALTTRGLSFFGLVCCEKEFDGFHFLSPVQPQNRLQVHQARKRLSRSGADH